LYWVVGGRVSREGSGDDEGPSLEFAVSSQLGLRLDAKKVSVSVLVVDHMDKMPEDN
jgi:uncharacterized protein (TIGR03435 family)